jgi:mono/diheme cytochrome c family protein
MRSILLSIALVFIILGDASHATSADSPKTPVDFEKDVRPIFAESCYRCHGPNKKTSDFRLDVKSDAMKGGDNGVAIVPGHSADSPMIQRVTGQDKDGHMPPSGKPLTTSQIAILKAWIDQGARWPDYPAAVTAKPHWAYQPLKLPPVPAIRNPKSEIRNPIDSFILAKLGEKGLAPSKPAEKRDWLRRVTFDLTGLPPTPDETREFLADNSPLSFERVVDRLLASPHYGERWAQHWMDVAHFAESHGNDQDRPRPNAWPYRDYLIRSFNEDKPYARFVAEQVAGDVLYPDDPQATVALGFLAAGPWDESSLRDIVADTIDNKIAQVLDRDDMLTTTMTTFVSSTVNCARCHNHKFDPISQQDYYSLQAVFAGVDRAERTYDPDPRVFARRRELVARRHALVHELSNRTAMSPESQKVVDEWERKEKSRSVAWEPLTPTSFSATNGSIARLQPDGSLLYSGKAPETDTYWITARIPKSGVTAFRLEVLADPSLPHGGPGRQDNGNLHLSEFRAFGWPGSGLLPIPLPIKRATADFNQMGWGIEQALDDNSKTAWGIYPEVGKSHLAVLELARPLMADSDMLVTFMLSQVHGGHHLIGRPRLSYTTAADPKLAEPLPSSISEILQIPPEKRTAAQRSDLARFALIAQIEEELASLPPQQLVYAAAHDFKPDGNFKPSPHPRPVNVLRRGDINSPAEPANPGTLACVPGLPSRFQLANLDDEGGRRAALARWLSNPNNVLTWRSIVNRVWHYHFGRGIVDTPNDFGHMGSTPTHPELLDWLACDFRTSGGSLKHLHKLIVLSATYRQTSAIAESDMSASDKPGNPKSEIRNPKSIDSDNRYLWRMNSSRLDAESLRDAILIASGKLDLKMSGPSVKQFIQKPGIHVTPIVDYVNFDVDDPANFRRSVYRFLFRTLPDPFMEAMDHPDASQQAPVRTSSMTSLQALAMLDNKFIVRQSEHLAERLQRESSEPANQIRRLYELTLNREPKPREIELLTGHAARYGLANVCRVILNSNEFVFVP